MGAVAGDGAVEGVSFDGFEACFSDGSSEVGGGDFLVGVGVADLGDVVPDDGSVDVVDAELERGLAETEGLHDPERFDVWEVVQDESAGGEHSEVVQCGGAGEVLEFGVVGDERQGDDGLEAAGVAGGDGAVLGVAEHEQVVDAVL